MLRRLLPSAACLLAIAADWPQWRGPNRDEISTETGLLKTWPNEGPRLAWTFEDAGIGYSGPSVVGTKLYLAGATGEKPTDKEFVLCLDTLTGKQVWKTEFGKGFNNNWGGGPRSNPTVNENVVYALGPSGDLVALDATSGKLFWEKNLVKDLGGKLMSGWGYSESVLIDGNKLICTPGGDKGTIAALDKKTGQLLWRSAGATDSAAYSSIIQGTVGGIAMYIQQTNKGLIGVSAETGKFLWRNDCPAYRTAVIPTPLFHDSHVYGTSGYGAGCTLVKLSPDGQGGIKAEEVYKNKIMVNHHGGVVLVDGHVYGYSDNERGWVCQNFLSGEKVWGSNKLGKGSLTCVDGDLLCYSENKGELVRIKATSRGWEESGRFTIPRETKLRKPSGKIWTHPVVANGKLYLRDQDLLFCFDLKDARAAK